MKILITGLTLHNNKGGPALALSLIDKLKTKFEDGNFYLSVPNYANNIELEQKWAEYYKIDGVVGSVGAKELLYINLKRRNIFLTFLKNMDLVVDLNALSYMDLDYMTPKQNLVSNLNIYTIRGLCNKLNIPLIRWTQSYGPFKSIISKKIIQMDLNKQKNIFARGEGSAKNIQELFPKKNIFSFPDIAITLAKNETYYDEYLKNKKYITLSPSSVIYSICGDLHIEHFCKIIDYIKKLNYEIVIVPHNLMAINPSLLNCDLKVSEQILSALSADKIHLVDKDIDVYNLKGIISNASLHIGARYHSIIASLSTGVPTIAFSWHEKYRDIMRMYNMEKYIYDGKVDIQILFDFIKELDVNQDEIKLTLKERQIILEQELEKNIELFMDNYYDM